MKRKLWIIALVSVLALAGCTTLFPSLNFFTFEEVSQPYLDKYGPPEEVKKYSSSNYRSVDWYWYSRGLTVGFVRTTYSNFRCWTVDHTYSF